MMMKKIGRMAIVVSGAWLSAYAQTSPDIPLKRGIYVIKEVSCKDPFFAAMATWDGVGFAGPHDSDCKTSILHKQKGSLDIETTCKALGDGTPTTATTWRQRLMVLSNTSYELIKKGGDGSRSSFVYRWCSGRLK